MVGMQWATFVEKYRPKKNVLCEGAPLDEFMFETFDEEFDFVKGHDAKFVWTLIDCEGGLYLSNGWHFVNRLGYVVTEVEHDVAVDLLVST